MVQFAEESCDLLIIGAGYAGVCALNAAQKYLPKGAKVVVVDRQKRWGGTFVHAYDYVRLHQPYQQFTAGEREWSIAKTKDRKHLATKTEILSHFDDIVEAAVNDGDLALEALCGYEADVNFRIENCQVSGLKRVQVDAYPISEVLSQDALPVQITAGRLINATGFDVAPKNPFTFSDTVAPRVHSLSPRDLLTPRTRADIKYSSDADKEIWVIGSGKTAMDTILALGRMGPEVASRVRCVAGRGTYFMNRDMEDTNAGNILECLHMYATGASGAQVIREFAKRGVLHTAVPDAASCMFGFCSVAEIEKVRAILAPCPAEAQKLVRAHLLNIVEGPGGRLLLKLRLVQPGENSISYRNLADGAFIVNCTDNIVENANNFWPVVSEDGLVLSPQNVLGFSGQSADLLTHAWFLGKLNDAPDAPGSAIWKQLPRVSLKTEDKSDAWIKLVFGVVMSTQMLGSILPRRILRGSRQINTGMAPPPPETMMLVPEIIQGCISRWPGRYTDPGGRGEAAKSQNVTVFGGRLEQSSHDHIAKL